MGDAIAEFRAAGTEPYGINHGSADSHRAFVEAQGFPFDLLVDDGLAVATAYGATKPDGSGIARTVVVVGKNGRVVFREAGAPPPGEVLAAINAAEDEP